MDGALGFIYNYDSDSQPLAWEAGVVARTLASVPRMPLGVRE